MLYSLKRYNPNDNSRFETFSFAIDAKNKANELNPNLQW